MRLKPEIISKIRNNSDLRICLREKMKCSETTLYLRLRRNDSTLTEYGILKFIASKLNESNIENLLEDIE